MDNYKLQEKLGDGTYGEVYKAIEISTNQTVAIKILKTKIYSWKECVNMSEVKTLQKLNNHINIIKLKELIRDDNSKIYMVFEYMEMNLYNLIEKHRRERKFLKESTVKIIVSQIIEGLHYMHSHGYIHRDLKPENILISYLENQDDSIKVKIADFGLAKQVSKNNVTPLTDYVCTRWYRAPEAVLKSRNYNHSVDIFALGCIMAELYNLKPLFPGANEVDQLGKIIKILGTPKFNDWPDGYKLINSINLKFPNFEGIGLKEAIPGFSDKGINILYKMLQYNPLNRISTRELIYSDYFSIKTSASKNPSPEYLMNYSLENLTEKINDINLNTNKNTNSNYNGYFEVNKKMEYNNFNVRNNKLMNIGNQLINNDNKYNYHFVPNSNLNNHNNLINNHNNKIYSNHHVNIGQDNAFKENINPSIYEGIYKDLVNSENKYNDNKYLSKNNTKYEDSNKLVKNNIFSNNHLNINDHYNHNPSSYRRRNTFKNTMDMNVY